MIAEDVLMLFAQNRNFLDLVLTFELEIDYGEHTNRQATYNRRSDRSRGEEQWREQGTYIVKDEEKTGRQGKTGSGISLREDEAWESDTNSKQDNIVPEEKKSCDTNTLF